MRKLMLLLVLACLLVLSGCGESRGASRINLLEKTQSVSTEGAPSATLTVPDVFETDELTAKNVLSANALIPVIKYEYNDTVAKGNVIRTEPEIGSAVEKNGKVIVYVSNGPTYIEAKSSYIEWENLSFYEDSWEFYAPFIENGVLYIYCHNVVFGCDMEWMDSYGEGRIGGLVAVTDGFEKTIPLSAKYQKQSWREGEAQSFVLEIPLSDLETERPTDIYIVLYTNNYYDVYINFYMTW